jgi:hypothetical protein
VSISKKLIAHQMGVSADSSLPSGIHVRALILEAPGVKREGRCACRSERSQARAAHKQAFYRLADEKRETILWRAASANWQAAFSRDDLIASHAADHPMPNLLDRLAAPDCSRLGSHWDRCGVHYVEPIEGAR